jgi:hypothetical protein
MKSEKQRKHLERLALLRKGKHHTIKTKLKISTKALKRYNGN